MTTTQPLVIGTRGSDLALVQARYIAASLALHGIEARLEIIRTQGDKITDVAFSKMVGKGFFTKELEDALLDKRIDLAVHSLKDLPTEMPEGLAIAAIPAREDPRDTLVIAKHAYDADAGVLPLIRECRVGTSAIRRQTQLLALRDDLQVSELRGNVPTRVQRLREGRYDAVVLAQAGLSRLQLDLSEFVTVVLDPEVFVPAPAQGALGIEVRANDDRVMQAVQRLHDKSVEQTVHAERLLLARLEGGCHLPLGAHATMHNGTVHLQVFLGGDGTSQRINVQGRHAEEVVANAFAQLKGH